MKPLFIFPVKECSTRLPRKNLLEINGKPLFYYPLKAMIDASRRFMGSFPLITTESTQILGLIDDLFDPEYYYYHTNLRPVEYAQDPYQIGDVCKYVMNKYNLVDYDPLVVVQSTLPFITAYDIIKCIELYKSPVNSVRVFRRIDKQWSMWNDSVHGKVARLYPDYEEGNDNVQSLGGIVVCRSDFVRLKGSFPQAAVPYILSKERAFDVDDETDFICVKALMEKDNANSSVRTCN